MDNKFITAQEIRDIQDYRLAKESLKEGTETDISLLSYLLIDVDRVIRNYVQDRSHSVTVLNKNIEDLETFIVNVITHFTERGFKVDVEDLEDKIKYTIHW